MAPTVRYRHSGRRYSEAGLDIRGSVDAGVRSQRSHETGLRAPHSDPKSGMAHGSPGERHGGDFGYGLREDAGVLTTCHDPHQRTGLARFSLPRFPLRLLPLPPSPTRPPSVISITHRRSFCQMYPYLSTIVFLIRHVARSRWITEASLRQLPLDINCSPHVLKVTTDLGS